MDDLSPFGQARRALLVRMLATGSLVALPGLVNGNTVREVSGQVWVDGEPATATMSVSPGAVVETGSGARFAYAVGKDAFMLRENSRVLFGSRDGYVVHAARVVTGALMAVFGGGDHTLASSHMVAGVRGTGVYLEVSRNDTYFCLCYGVGEAQLSPQLGANAGSDVLAMSSTGHNAYRFLPGRASADERIAKAGIENHTDAELYMLEKFVGRTPPFVMGEGSRSPDARCNDQ